MEHADDIMLELAGICDRDRVTVGGVVDTRNSKKPLSTNVKVTGRTFEGKISTHTFTLGDETSMAAKCLWSCLWLSQSWCRFKPSRDYWLIYRSRNHASVC